MRIARLQAMAAAVEVGGSSSRPPLPVSASTVAWRSPSKPRALQHPDVTLPREDLASPAMLPSENRAPAIAV